ncbi:MAG: chorismate mutase [Rhodobiaceae bacterium]|nr:chorismate mutase [Rhodobiaceae bacterium]MCC0016778.1 chorismate mutase [Rhodobiaceae bacterium]MCC0042615.1 chorismate mutase [Rhodobiaceae bacterium]
MSLTPSDDAEALAGLRREIDEIDAEMHVLLQRRADVIGRLVSVKKTKTGAAFRPEREAAMMQRLAARHRGELPFLTIAHIWRVIISTFTQLQAPYRVHLGGSDPALRDIARYQFGFSTPLVSHPGRDSALSTLNNAASDLALVLNGGDSDWWTPAVARGSHVIAAIPEIAVRDADAFAPALVFAAASVAVDELPRAVLALACDDAGALARVIETGSATILCGPVETGTRALVAIERTDVAGFLETAQARGVAVTPAGGAAIPVAPATA